MQGAAKWLIMRVLIVLLALVTVAWCETGVIYYAEGGTGGGLVHLLSQGNLVKLRWKKGQLLEQGLSSSQGWRPGAIWDYDQEEGYLQRARFEQSFQPQVRAAVELVEDHYACLRQADWNRAYANLSPAWKKQQSLEDFRLGQQKLRYRKEPAPSYALKVIGHNSNEVLVLVNSAYFLAGDRSYFRYTLVRNHQSFCIDRGEAITADDWEHS